jgi:hypothetical protein
MRLISWTLRSGSEHLEHIYSQTTIPLKNSLLITHHLLVYIHQDSKK